MKSKILSLFLLTTIFSLLMVSATDGNFSFSASTAQTQTIDSITGFTNITNAVFAWDNSSITQPIVTIPTLTSVTVDISPIDTKSLDLGKTYTGKITITNSTGTQTIRTFELKPTYCKYGTNNKYLKLDVDIKNKGIGQEDTEWYPFDDIEVKANVENIWDDGVSTTDDDLSKVTVEWCLYDKTKGECTDIKDEESSFKLNEGKDKDLTINFKVNPNDLDTDSTEYAFYVKAYSDSSSFGEKVSCIEFSDLISIQRDNFMLLNNVVIPETIECKGTLDITGEVWNIADDQEDEVSMRIYNKDLGINEIIQLGDIDALESSDFSVEYKIPAGLTDKKLYPIEFRILDENGDVYSNDNDDDSIFLYQIKVDGCGISATTTQNVLITAELDSTTPEAVPGKQVIIKATIKNTGTSTITPIISISGNSAWSSLKSIDPQTLTLNAGESKTVNILLNIDADAEGEKEFTITSTSGDKITEQKVALSLTKSNATSSIIANHLKANWFIYVIVLVNIILIITIIAVVKSMVGRGNSL